MRSFTIFGAGPSQGGAPSGPATYSDVLTDVVNLFGVSVKGEVLDVTTDNAYEETTPTTPISNGSVIGLVEGRRQTGTAVTLTQASAANKPFARLQGGYYGMHFPGTGDIISDTSVDFPAQPFVIAYSAYNLTNVGADYEQHVLLKGGTGATAASRGNNVNDRRHYMHGGSGSLFGTAADQNAFYRRYCVFDGDSSYGERNGVTDISGTGLGNGGSNTQMYVGNNNGATTQNCSNTYIMRIVIIPVADANYTIIDNFLKFGIM